MQELQSCSATEWLSRPRGDINLLGPLWHYNFFGGPSSSLLSFEAFRAKWWLCTQRVTSPMWHLWQCHLCGTIIKSDNLCAILFFWLARFIVWSLREQFSDEIRPTLGAGCSGVAALGNFTYCEKVPKLLKVSRLAKIARIVIMATTLILVKIAPQAKDKGVKCESGVMAWIAGEEQ